jgi:hypothetical protein
MKINRGKVSRPLRAVLYGAEGIGKSTFASQWPEPLYCDLESGTGQLDVARLETPTSWAMLQSMICALGKDSQGFKTLVLDTSDALDRMVQEHVCNTSQKQSIEEFGYGRGYVVALEEWRKFLDLINELQACQSMHVLFLAHAQIKKFEQPDEFGSYDRWEMKMDKRSGACLREWSDLLLFANYRTVIVKDDKSNSRKAQGGERVIYTEHRPCWDAKNRFGLPEEILIEGISLPKEIKGIFASMQKNETNDKQKKEPVKANETRQSSKPIEYAKPPEEMDKPNPSQEEPIQKADNKQSSKHLEKLYDLIALHGVSVADVQAVVAKQGYYPIDTPLENYKEEFVLGRLIPRWEVVAKMIEKMKNN